MPPISPRDPGSRREPHPLARRLIDRLGAPGARVLDFATGSGRNARALRAAGHTVIAVEDAAAASGDPCGGAGAPFDAAVSTHGLLHGTAGEVGARLESIAAALRPNAPLYATFGSVRDRRFGAGTRIDASTFAPAGGDEAGVPHAYFTREELERALQRHFTIESLEESAVDDVAGAWAHARDPLHGAVHWFAVVRRTPQ